MPKKPLLLCVMIETRNIHFSYPESKDFRFDDFSCKQGEHWLITGPSGCGKTTFLHILAGLLPVSEGDVLLGGVRLNGLPASRVDKIRGKSMGIIFQVPHFIQSLTVGENLALALHLSGEKPDRQRIESLLDQLNIGDKYAAYPNRLSQGEQQRLSVARAVVHRPAVILADEPTSSLDDANCSAALQLLREQAKELNASLLIVTHDNRLYPHFNHIMRL